MNKHTIHLADGREATICFVGDYIILEEGAAVILYKKVAPAPALLDIADLTEQPNADSTL